MTNVKFVREKILIAVLAVLLVAALSIGGTLAFLTDSEETTNVFTVGDLDITLHEPNWNPVNGTDLRPGSTTTKDPVVKAVESDSYMRVYVYYVDNADGDGTIENDLITDADRLNLIKKTIYHDSTFNPATPAGAIDVDEKYSLAQLAALAPNVVNGVNSSYAKDTARSAANGSYDVYNYTANSGIFAEGTEAILFTNIVVPTDWNQAEMNKLGKFKIVIKAQAIQTEGFENADEAFAALDAEVTAGTIQINHGVTG